MKKNNEDCPRPKRCTQSECAHLPAGIPFVRVAHVRCICDGTHTLKLMLAKTIGSNLLQMKIMRTFRKIISSYNTKKNKEILVI